MSPAAKQTGGTRHRRGSTAGTRHGAPARLEDSPSRARLIPWLAAGATLWAAVPPLWPGLGVPITQWSVLFGVAAGIVAVFVARTAAALRRPGDISARATTAGLLALVVITPVVFDPRTVDGFNLVKFTATVVAALVIVAGWAVEVVRPGPSPRWRNGLHWPVLALVAWTVIATATSVSPRLSILGATNTNDGLLAAVALAVIFFAVVQAFTPDQVKAVLSVLYFGAGGLTVLYGLIQLHDRLWPGGQWDWIREISGEGMQSFASGAIFSTLGNPNHLAGFLAVLVPVGVVLFLLERSRRVRVLVVAVMAGVVLELLQTASRGALLAALVSLGVAGTLLWPEVRRRPKMSLPGAGAVVAAVVVTALALASVPQFSTKLSSGLDPSSTLTLRADIWKVGLTMANARPLVGHGPDTWIDRAAKYQDSEAVTRYRGRAYYTNGAHSLFVSQLAATGYPGLILLLAVLAFATVRAVGAWRRLRQAESDGNEDEQSRARQARLCLAAVVAGLAAFLVQASFNLSQTGLSFVLWLLLGLLCVLSLGAGVPTGLRARALVARPVAAALPRAHADPRARTSPAGDRRQAEGSDLTTGAVTVMVCLGLAFAVSTATRPLRADHNAAASVFYQAMARRAPPDQAAGLSRRSTTRLTDAIDINPWEASYLARRADGAFTSVLALPAGSPSQTTLLRSARRDYARVVELRPASRYLGRYADILLKIHEIDPGDRNARPEAIRLLRRAVTADPYSQALRDVLQRVLEG